MSTPERRLLAILAADVVGYSRLMEADEAGTLARLKGLRSELIDPAIARHHGRIVKSMGDGMLVAFDSAVDAVRCAAEIQHMAQDRNQALPEDEKIVLRIGVNVGDVALLDGDVYGDGVNIASRIEQLCEPGGVLISGTAFDQLQGRLDLPFDFAGEQQVKNISRPVRLYALRRARRCAGRRRPATLPACPLWRPPSFSSSRSFSAASGGCSRIQASGQARHRRVALQQLWR